VHADRHHDTDWWDIQRQDTQAEAA
jgi:hypothetical protein